MGAVMLSAQSRDLKTQRACLLCLCLLLGTVTHASSAAGQNAVADFYNGKTIFLQIGAAIGGSYDTAGRLFAKYLGKYLPGHPNVVAQNVPGLQLADQFGNTTARDGTYFGIFNNGMPTAPLTDARSAHYDARKFYYLGSPNRQTQMIGLWHTARTKTIDDLFKQETIVGVTAAGSAGYDYSRLANAMLGTKFKIIPGYEGIEDSKLAMERGEVDATYVNRSSIKTDFADAIRAADFILVAAFGMKQDSTSDQVPLMPLGETIEDRQLFELMYARQDYGLPFIMPPDVPVDRAAALRRAFELTMRDPNFRTDAERINLDIDPVSGDELTKLTARLYETPPTVISRMLKILSPDRG